LKAQYENEKHRGDQINEIRKKLDELKAKADDAERKYDLATASDIRYYAIPDLANKAREINSGRSREWRYLKGYCHSRTNCGNRSTVDEHSSYPIDEH
jgi:hypothetical protein